MSKINRMRMAYYNTYQNMPIVDFMSLAGAPDSISGTCENGIFTWQDSVWKGIVRGGTIYRRVTLYVKGGRIVQYLSENLDVSNW